MFGRPQFPLPTADKVAIEFHLDWLLRRFGLDPIREYPTLTPRSPEVSRFFQTHRFEPSELLEFIAKRYPFACDGCEISAWNGVGVPPLNPHVILLSPEEQAHPVAMANRMATHLAQRYLLNLPESEWRQTDFVMLAELLPLYFGWGIFSANMTLITSMYTHGDWHEWKHQKFTENAARHFGAALAYRSWIRDDPEEQKLSRFLRPDAEVPYRRALRYLTRTGDSLVFNDAQPRVFQVQSLPQLEFVWENASHTITVASLRRVLELTEPGMLLKDSMGRSFYQMLPVWLDSNDESVRLLACRVADRFDQLDGEALDCLKDRLSDPVPEVRQAATQCIVYLAPAGEIQARDLRRSLKDQHEGTVKAAVRGLVYLQQREESLVADLLRLIRRALNEGQDEDSLQFLVASLDVVALEPEKRLCEFLREDPDSLQTIQQILADWRDLVDDTDAAGAPAADA